MELLEALSLIRPIPDYPKPGILFQDITPLLANAEAFAAVVRDFAAIDAESTAVAGIEARGFILGSAIALQRNNGFIPLRKSGKLPFTTHSRSYGLEYGEDKLEIHTDALSSHRKVFLVDDVLATGGTIDAGLQLISDAGGLCTEVAVLLEIRSLGGRQRLLEKYPTVEIHALVTM